MKKHLKTLLVAMLLVPCILLFTACSSDELKELQKQYDELQKQLDDATKPQTLYGDVNLDGKIDYDDCLWLIKHVEEEITLDAQALISADVDGDGEITYADANVIKYFVDGDLTSLDPKDFSIVWGDFNCDGVLDETDQTLFNEYFSTSGAPGITTQQYINMDLLYHGLSRAVQGRVNGYFAGNQENILGESLAYNPGTLSWNTGAHPNDKDVTALAKFLAGEETFYLDYIRNADINDDGKIDAVDLWLLMQMVDAG